MQNPLIKSPGMHEEMDIRCPKCNSKDITIRIDEKGYFEVFNCNKCKFALV